MLKRYQNWVDRFYIFLNGILIVGVFASICWYFSLMGRTEFSRGELYIRSGMIFALCVMLCMYVKRFSTSTRITSYWNVIESSAVCFLYGLLSYALGMMLFKLPQISRVYFWASFILSFFAICLFNLLSRKFYAEIRKKDFNFRTILIVADKQTIKTVISEIEENKFLGLKIMGLVGFEDKNEFEGFQYAYCGNIRQFGQILNDHVIDYVLFSNSYPNLLDLHKAMALCRERGIEMWVKPDSIFESPFSKVDYLGDMPLFIYNFTPKSINHLIIKRLLDLVISGSLLLILSVPLLIVGYMIKLTSPGPSMFKQKRVGLGGRVFTMYKFRTMYNEKREDLPLINEMQGPAFKMKEDPRITPLGKFLRKWSIDEFPQLWNVFWGEMSLVGPRPALPSEVVMYQGWQRRRFSMRPGITCIWQVEGRNKITDFNQWVKLDLKYIDRWSVGLDIKIFFQTIIAVIRGTGV